MHDADSDASDQQAVYDAANRARWDELVAVHRAGPEGYRVAEFLAGESILDPLVAGEIGEVTGKRVLHLQCHFGLDTLSLARLGAEVTGVDFSAKAIAAARALSAESGVPGRFVACKVEDAPAHIDGPFDLVFASWGTINWLPDLTRWAQVIAQVLAPGGGFYMAEGHPFLFTLDEVPADAPEPLVVRYPCLARPRPLRFDEPNDYADQDAELANRTAYEWPHGLGEVVTALSRAGLAIDYLREHEVVPWKAIPALVKKDRYFWELPESLPRIPLSFSLRAAKA